MGPEGNARIFDLTAYRDLKGLPPVFVSASVPLALETAPQITLEPAPLAIEVAQTQTGASRPVDYTRRCDLIPQLFITPGGKETVRERARRVRRAVAFCNLCTSKESCYQLAVTSKASDCVLGGEEWYKGKVVTNRSKKTGKLLKGIY